MKMGLIYEIANSTTGKVYIGSSKGTNRWTQHIYALSRGEHVNQALQTNWKQFGEAAFTFRIVERCPLEQLRSKEQYWLDLVATDKQYNATKHIVAQCAQARTKTTRKIAPTPAQRASMLKWQQQILAKIRLQTTSLRLPNWTAV